VLVTKRSAAISQLEAAISIWFEEGDTVAIHTLTVAAHDCFNALLEHGTKMPSLVNKIHKSQSRGYQDRVRMPQNFFKHGKRDLKATLIHIPVYTDMMMLDAVRCYQKLEPGNPRVLLEMFTVRMFYEHSHLITEEAKPQFLEFLRIEQLHGTTRNEFLERAFPIFSKRYGFGEIHPFTP